MSRLEIISAKIFFTILPSIFYTACFLYANRHFDSSEPVYQTSKIIIKESYPEIDFKLLKNSHREITYSAHVDKSFYDTINPGDNIIIGLRKGALGIAYVNSIEKAGQ